MMVEMGINVPTGGQEARSGARGSGLWSEQSRTEHMMMSASALLSVVVFANLNLPHTLPLGEKRKEKQQQQQTSIFCPMSQGGQRRSRKCKSSK